MFTTILRRRVPAFLAAGAAAVAVLGLAAPAGASTGPRQTSPEQAGYTANHALFKEVDATVYLRDPTQFSGIVARYGHSVQLWAGAGLVVSLNFTASTSGGTYTPSATIYNGGTHQVIASDPNAKHKLYRDESWSPGVGGPWGWGDSVWLYIGYSPVTGHLEMEAQEVEYVSSTIQWSYELYGQSFDKARIGSNFGSSPWDAFYSYTPPANPVKLASYTRVHLTSTSDHGDDLSSSWWMRHKLLAQPPGRGLVAIPHDLTDRGASLQTWFVPKSAQGSS